MPRPEDVLCGNSFPWPGERIKSYVAQVVIRNGIVRLLYTNEMGSDSEACSFIHAEELEGAIAGLTEALEHLRRR